MPPNPPPLEPEGEESVPGFEKFGDVEPDAQAIEERGVYEKGDEQRHEEKKQAAHNITIRVFQLFAIVLCIVFVIRIYHLVIPHCWEWLDSGQLQTIDYLIFSGVIGGVIGGHLKQIFGLDE
jgi:hypothetical protein